MRKAVYLIGTTVASLFGAYRLYHAFRNNGDVDGYLVGVVFVALGATFFWKLYHPSQD